MVKRGRLSKVELYYIAGNIEMPVEEIAKELDRSEAVIRKELNKLNPEIPAVEPEPEPEPEKKEAHIFKLMGRHKRDGQNVATVMTKAASEFNDSRRSEVTMSKKVQDAIHRPIKD